MTGVLIAVGIGGWVLCVVGAILSARGATRISLDTDGTPCLDKAEDHRASLGLWLTVGGASVGLVGTVWALLI